MTRRTLIILGAVIVALVIAVAVLVVVIVGQNGRASNDERHRLAVQICERTYQDPYGADLDDFTKCVTDLENSDRPLS